MRAAKKIFLLDLDRAALELAMVGHSVPKYFQGQPVWVVDEQVAGDARDLDETGLDFEIRRAGPGRSLRADTGRQAGPGARHFAAESDAVEQSFGELICPRIYGEKIEHEHTSAAVFGSKVNPRKHSCRRLSHGTILAVHSVWHKRRISSRAELICWRSRMFVWTWPSLIANSVSAYCVKSFYFATATASLCRRCPVLMVTL